jgi:hypothetical protein
MPGLLRMAAPSLAQILTSRKVYGRPGGECSLRYGLELPWFLCRAELSIDRRCRVRSVVELSRTYTGGGSLKMSRKGSKVTFCSLPRILTRASCIPVGTLWRNLWLGVHMLSSRISTTCSSMTSRTGQHGTKAHQSIKPKNTLSISNYKVSQLPSAVALLSAYLY